jgi:hypothetical protein
MVEFGACPAVTTTLRSRNLMYKALVASFLLLTCISTVVAHTGGEVDFICPVDGTKFSGWQDFSGTSFGARLDLKKTGPIAQPWALPDCPKCHFVIFDADAPKESIEKLKPFLSSEAYQKASQKPSYYRLALIQEHQKLSAYEIGWSYLRASWQSEENKEEYANCLERALQAFSKASIDLAKSEDKHADYLISCYLPIEILRKLSQFDKASKAVADFPPIGKTEIEWLPQVLEFQKELISAKDSSNHEIGDATSKK